MQPMKRDANKPFGHTGPAWAEKAQAYRILAEETNDVPYALDRGGRVLHVGPQIAAYGLDPADIISRPFTDFLAPADRASRENSNAPAKPDPAAKKPAEQATDVSGKGARHQTEGR